MTDTSNGSTFRPAGRYRHRFFTRSNRAKENLEHFGRTNNVQTFYEGPDFDEDSPKWVEYAPPSLALAKKTKREGAALQIYKRRNEDYGHETFYIYQIKLQSPYLREALQETLERYGIIYMDKTGADSYAPHRGLFFALDRIAQLAQTAEDEITRSHCELLRSIVEEIFGDRLDELELLEKEDKITYDLLWTLFPCGSIFGWQNVSSPPVGLRVKNVHQDDDRLKLTCEMVKFDGFRYGFVNTVLKVHEFAGSVDISALPDFHYIDLERNQDLRRRLIERGKKALDLQSFHYMEYMSATEPEEDAGGSKRKVKDIQRVIVDAHLFSIRRGVRVYLKPLPAYKLPPPDKTTESSEISTQDHGFVNDALEKPQENQPDLYRNNWDANMSRKSIARGQYSTEQTDEPEATRRPTKRELERNRQAVLESEDYLLIMDGTVVGYSLATRRWEFFRLDNLRPLHVDTEVFNKVVFNETTKDVLRTLVESHKEGTAQQDDFVMGKGECLLVILSGPPGTGKTLMAECLAEHLASPLLRAEPSYIQRAIHVLVAGYEASFGQFLKDASEWGGLVLFDEPDFLFQTQHSGADRQGLLAFLRYAEYFKGIIILTTNLGTSIDPAVISRAHIHIKFPVFTKAMRVQVWQNFVERLPSDVGTLDGAAINDLASWKVNGREIKNILNLSVTWCQKKKRLLSVEVVENLIITTIPGAIKSTGNESETDKTVIEKATVDDFSLLDI